MDLAWIWDFGGLVVLGFTWPGAFGFGIRVFGPRVSRAWGEKGFEDLRLEFGDCEGAEAVEASNPPPRCRLQSHHGGTGEGLLKPFLSTLCYYRFCLFRRPLRELP